MDDALARFRAEFAHEEGGPIYADGNSLGRLPLRTRDRLAELLDEWGTDLVRGWHGWIELPERIGDELGAAVLGAAPGQTLVCDSVTVNLYKLAGAVLAARPERSVIVTDAGQLPDRPLRARRARRGAEVRIRSGRRPDRRRRRARLRGRGRRDREPLPRRLPLGRAGRPPRDHRRGARRRRARPLGSQPLRRRGRDRPGRGRRRSRGRLHLQVPERGSGSARVPLRPARPRRGAPLADPGLVRAARAVRHGPCVRPGRWDPPLPGRDALDPRARVRAGGNRADRRGRDRGDRGQGASAHRARDRTPRRPPGTARLHARHAARPGPPRRARRVPPRGGLAHLPRPDRARRGHPGLPRPGHRPLRLPAALHELGRRHRDRRAHAPASSSAASTSRSTPS